MFASETTQKVTIGDVIVTIQKLNWRQLRQASEKVTELAMQQALAAGADMLKAFRDIGKATEEAKPKPGADREAVYRSYDRMTVLNYGVKSWTSAVSLVSGLDDLDEPTADLLHRAIIDLSIPAQETDEAARGEGSLASTVP